MNEKNHLSSARGSARRRLIRGAFAAPAVMTLYSGSAFAASSQAARCITNMVKDAEFPVSPAQSTWLRVQRFRLLQDGTSGLNSVFQYYVRGQDIVALQEGKFSGLYLNSTQFQKITNDTTAPIIVNASPTSGNNNLQIDTGNFVAVRVDSQGKIVGIVGSGNTSNSSAVAQTCWSSFVAV